MPAPPRSRADSAGAIKRALRAAELVPASGWSQALAYVEIVLAISLLSVWLDRPSLALAAGAALAVGIVVSVATPIGGLFVNLSGAVVAVIAVVTALFIWAYAEEGVLGLEPWWFAVVGLLPLGLDWRFAPRLRARAVASGVLVVPVVGAATDWGYAGAVAWFVLLCVLLWSLERDGQRAAMRPIPVDPRAAPAPRSRVADLLRTAGIALACGLLVALLLGDARCSPREATFGGSGGRTSASGAGITGPPTPLYGLDGSGREYQFGIDGRGGRYLIRPGSPTARYERDGDRIVVEDADGSRRTYDRDGAGRERVTIEDQRGTRTYVYEQQGDQIRVREYDEDGDFVCESIFGSGGSASSGGAGAAGSSGRATADGTTPTDRDEESSNVPWLAILLGLLVVAAIAGGVWWLTRRRPRSERDLSWAERMAARLAWEGARRGRPRAPSETVVEHSTALVDSVLPDRRLRTVGDVLSASLFGRTEPPTATRQWVEQVVDDATEAAPVTRSRRRSARRP